MSKYKIAVIVAWFGPLPGYFPAWLRSAEMNPDIDFFLFFDQEVKSECPNIHVERTTLEQEAARASRELAEEVSICNAYKFCDVRPFFGRIYHEWLREYDFWGFCDIDLVFGNIRSFLTDEVLSQYERFYEWGHFSLFRNNEKINHIYDLPGGLYSRSETLCGTAKVVSEEHYGLNRICEKNNIKWYRKTDFADFYVYCSALRLTEGRRNYVHQAFYWEDGRVYRAAIDEDGKVVITNEYVYIHWQKRKPKLSGDGLDSGSFFITSNELIRKEKGIPDAGTIAEISPEIDDATRRKEKAVYFCKKTREFLKAPLKQKEIWIRQKMVCIKETKTIWGQREYLYSAMDDLRER